MKKKWQITEEEFEAIKEAITDALSLCHYDIISAKNEFGYESSMSVETFFKILKNNFIIKIEKL